MKIPLIATLAFLLRSGVTTARYVESDGSGRRTPTAAALIALGFAAARPVDAVPDVPSGFDDGRKQWHTQQGQAAPTALIVGFSSNASLNQVKAHVSAKKQQGMAIGLQGSERRFSKPQGGSPGKPASLGYMVIDLETEDDMSRVEEELKVSRT